MDENIEKAFEMANYMATLTNQRRLIQEELSQRLVYYVNGGTFKITPELINFTKTVLDLGHDTEVIFLDENKLPIVVADVQDFLDNLVSIYFESINNYHAKYAELKSKRQVEALVSL
jgi:hypothetical protein